MAEAHPARRGMNHHLINPKYQATIRSPPEIEVKAHAFTVQTTPTISTEGFLYWTPRNGDAPYKPNKRGLLPAEDQGTGKRGLGHLNDLPVQPRFIFTHGRGRKIDNLGFINFVSGIARTFPVLVWNGVEDINDRVQTYNYLYNDGQQTYVGIGGRSTGGRASVRTSAFSRNKKLVLWSYPLVRNSEVRSPELLALSADTRVLFIRGANDYVCTFSFPYFSTPRVTVYLERFANSKSKDELRTHFQLRQIQDESKVLAH